MCYLAKISVHIHVYTAIAAMTAIIGQVLNARGHVMVLQLLLPSCQICCRSAIEAVYMASAFQLISHFYCQRPPTTPPSVMCRQLLPLPSPAGQKSGTLLWRRVLLVPPALSHCSDYSVYTHSPTTNALFSYVVVEDSLFSLSS